MIYTFDNEEVVDVVMFKKILPTDIKSTFQLIQKYAGLLNAPPDSVLYHKTLVFLKHLRYRYHVYSFDLSPTAKQYCQAYEQAFPVLKVEAKIRPPVEPPTIEWDDEPIEEVEDDGTLLPCECDPDDTPDSVECKEDVEFVSQKVESKMCESTDDVSKLSPLQCEQQDPAYKEYVDKISRNKEIVNRSLQLLADARTKSEINTSPPVDPNVKLKKRKVSCSPSFGMQMTRAIFGVPVKYAAKGSRVARKLLGLSDDSEAHLYVDQSGLYYACGGETEVDVIRASPVKERGYFDQQVFSYKGGTSPTLLIACDLKLQDPGGSLLKVSDAETLSWEKQCQDMRGWINHLRRGGRPQIT